MSAAEAVAAGVFPRISLEKKKKNSADTLFLAVAPNTSLEQNIICQFEFQSQTANIWSALAIWMLCSGESLL